MAHKKCIAAWSALDWPLDSHNKKRVPCPRCHTEKMLSRPDTVLKVYIDMSCVHCQTLMHALLPRPVIVDQVSFETVEVDSSHPRVTMSEFPHVYKTNKFTSEEYKVRSRHHKDQPPPDPSAPPPPYSESAEVVDMFVDIANVLKNHPDSHNGEGKRIDRSFYDPVAGKHRYHDNEGTECGS